MIKSEEHKLDKLEQELLNIEKFAKNLDLNSEDEDRMVLTNIVSKTQNVPKNQSENDLINSLNNIKGIIEIFKKEYFKSLFRSLLIDKFKITH